MKAPYVRGVDGGIVVIHTAGGKFLDLCPTNHIAEDAPIFRAKASHPKLTKAIYGTGDTATQAMQDLINELFLQLPDAPINS